MRRSGEELVRDLVQVGRKREARERRDADLCARSRLASAHRARIPLEMHEPHGVTASA